MPEDNRTEYKRDLTENFEKSVVSFLNYSGGGEIILGFDDDGSVRGINESDIVQRQIVDRIRNNIRPQTLGLFDVVQDCVDNKNIIRVIVSCGQLRPYYIRKKGMSEVGCFIRVGSSVQPMSKQMIEHFLSKRQKLTLQNITSPRQSLSFQQLAIYYSEKKFTLTARFQENLDLIGSDGKYNYVAYLLADENGNSMKVATYAGTDKINLSESREYGYRCLITAAQKILDRVDSDNRTFVFITPQRRINKERINSVALREIIINAVVHNDYSKGVPLIELFKDKIVITSCGGLVEGLSEEDFFNCRSMPRNRELMRVFRDLDYVEQIGSGMKRILKVYDRSIFEFSPSFTIVTLPYEEGFILPNENINGQSHTTNGKDSTFNGKDGTLNGKDGT
ncbi:MAG: putative DNA binding domain-containing protein [Deltaproteobacteria bacterium]|nr:putative DNA binding domain-containing protein [Deltaproteobacteria bacterium]